MHCVGIDVIDMRADVDGDKKWIIQMKDALTGVIWAEALADKRSVTIATFVQSVFQRSGVPDVIETNYASEYTGKQFKTMLETYPNMEHRLNTAPAIQLMRQANQTLKNKINELIERNKEEQRTWTQVLPVAVAEINETTRLESLDNHVDNGEDGDYCPAAVVTCIISDGEDDAEPRKPSPVLLYAKNRHKPVAVGLHRPEIGKVHGIHTSTDRCCYEILKVLRNVSNEHNPFEDELQPGSFVLWNRKRIVDNIRQIIKEIEVRRKEKSRVRHFRKKKKKKASKDKVREVSLQTEQSFLQHKLSYVDAKVFKSLS